MGDTAKTGRSRRGVCPVDPLARVAVTHPPASRPAVARIRHSSQATVVALVEALFFVFCGMALMTVLRQASVELVGEVDGFCGPAVPVQVWSALHRLQTRVCAALC